MRFTIFANWWALTLRASMALLFGAAALAYPSVDHASLAQIFGTYVVAAGTWNIVGALRSARVGERPGPLFFEGLTSAIAGAITLLWPAPSAVELACLVAARSIATAAFELWAAVRLRRIVPGERLLALSGATSVGLGLLLLAVRPASPRALALATGVHALAYGTLLLVLSLRLRARSPAVRHAGGARPAGSSGAGGRRSDTFALAGNAHRPADVGPRPAASTPRVG